MRLIRTSTCFRWLLMVCCTAPLSAQTKVSFASLGATVGKMHFFPGDAEIVPRSQRFYMTEYDSATTKFITTELDLDYPKVTSAVTVTLQCDYVGPTSVHSPVLNVTIQPGWTGSYHAVGWGAKNRGTWAVGSYQVICREGDRVIARGEFTVTRDTWDLPPIHGMVSGFRLFEGPKTMPVLNSRQYTRTFKSSDARWIYFEVGVDYPSIANPASFTMDCTYDFPDGRSFPVQIKPKMEAGWTGSYHAGGLGFDEPGKWAVGSYKVNCRYQGRLIATVGFSVE